ncbi:type 2 lanthipeptide synthetase LanM family protein [Planobispora siamensis]|uniref:Lanthionine synthetase n=1 Tax=Planobispora siamensis TaxID=936338 RepID=A0A8J3WKM8_9ACTN|nr:type 2 lanthipeptide synthetase LanM family protein [Planobispora siamensis]GIH94324.1 lanthionine synthetase [Planobispora siamensis]
MTAVSPGPAGRWADALGLDERIGLLRAAGPAPTGRGDGRDTDRTVLARWRAEPQFASAEQWPAWLEHAGVTEPEFGRALQADPSWPSQAGPPPWWRLELQRAYGRPQPADTPVAGPGAPGRPLKSAWGEEQRAFLWLVQPLVTRGRERLCTGLAAVAETTGTEVFDSRGLEESLLDVLLPELLRMVNRTLVMELNLSRLRGELRGATARERFTSFVEGLRDVDTALRLLDRYPVLGRRLAVRTEWWLQAGLEFARRLVADHRTLRAAFSPGRDPGVVTGVAGNLGDSHCRGRSVLIAEFAHGLRVVYKPRPMAVAAHFQQLLSWLNHAGATPPLRVLTVVDRGAYGWAEYVAHTPCSSLEEVRDFYLRQGEFLALLYALQATDFHGENVLASGAHPVMVDLEALFHPAPVERDLSSAEQVAAELLEDSVLRVGLLPQRTWATADSPGFDMSGIGAADGQLTPYGVPHCKDAGTDVMRVVREPKPVRGCRSRPRLPDGGDADFRDHADAVLQGFRHFYGLLLAHRDELLAPAGPLAAFAGDEVRVVLRETRTYGTLLYESLHPSVLRDGMECELLFARLWSQVATRPYLARVVACEREQLWDGDVPVFTARAGSRDLTAGTGARFDGFLPESGLDRVRRRIRRLGPEDLERQIWLIEGTLAAARRGLDPMDAKTPPAGRAAGAPSVRDVTRRELPGRDRLLAAAGATGDRLEALALRGKADEDAVWPGFSLAGHGQWTPTVLGPDLYDGTAGIALFLGRLASVTGEDRYASLARAATRTLERQVSRAGDAPQGIGAFNGLAGAVYALTHLGVLTGTPRLLDRAQEVAERLPPLIELDDQYDVIAGAAGCIGALACLHRARPTPGTLSAAVRCGDHLLSHSRLVRNVPTWPNPPLGPEPLTGFSHGTAGIAWALAELAELSGLERFRTTAYEALSYERERFDAGLANWPDLRTWGDPGADRRPMVAWCHGAAGIGLGRLAMLSHCREPDRAAGLRAEALIAAVTASAQGFGQSHSLCHGDLGNLELLTRAADTLGEPELSARAAVAATRVLDAVERGHRQCGLPIGVESPGLMTGLAGIGYGLLRLAEPSVPSVLLLEGP